ncbi:MAG: D-glycero-beta-D-manno-heptose 1-phosphate adenylyltransferase [Saprospiraceae bacterium]|jgi:rfaE bifunctional protein nucleotidyltransferase chain/domain|nr:D-glycero-beta-D-manno-heptose 1-phosphate adenylyltransferase [Saprospiraceae bacterium]MDC3219783.1 D-glycero-beta-D-manno-heptose 1-phosphate adenylyltransferase [Saprospiraceae bacterium]MDG1432623.1 D-glycero-beta-D-manno-heptose 1-phosphate adenylyltransferase [Saprospiraceae bacterium]MDG2418495.1 D-glycero-beta-D-manno-heptose 1-phosphate adenylyltransferase [Saprospiraceae bacterium]
MLKKIQSKIQSWKSIQSTVSQWKLVGEKIVFTNGCFDILHFGHIHYLAEASELGDRLVIGLNSEASVKRLKGEHRPINDEVTRQYLLAALEFVDGVVVFEEDTPLELIKTILPDVIVKGGDWKSEQIVGSDIVLANGGQVKSLVFKEGYSTTLIEEKIRKS